MNGGSRSCLDTRLPRGADDDDCSERFERGVVQAASLIKHFIDERAEVRLVLGEDVGPFGSGNGATVSLFAAAGVGYAAWLMEALSGESRSRCG